MTTALLFLAPFSELGLNKAMKVAMAMGEYALASLLVRGLHKSGVCFVCAASRRLSHSLPDGTRLVRLEFLRFRDYPGAR